MPRRAAPYGISNCRKRSLTFASLSGPKSIKLDQNNPGEYFYDVSVKNSTTGKRTDYKDFFGAVDKTPAATSKEWIAEYETHLEDSKCAPIVSATQSAKLARAHIKETLVELNKKVKNCEWYSPTLQAIDPKGQYEYSVPTLAVKMWHSTVYDELTFLQIAELSS